MRIRIAARHSDLARLQAYRVGEAIGKVTQSSVEYQFRASLGDINLNDPLWKMPEKGVFTEDFVRDLTEGTADLVVHSWKDLPTQTRIDTEVVATLPRADVRDVLLFRSDRLSAARESGQVRILTSSPRRSHNLKDFLSSHLPFRVVNLDFEPVRGNIPTRLKKLLAQDVDGLIVAKAALDRLLSAHEAEFAEAQGVIRSVLSQVRVMVLPLAVNPTAAAQGALAIEIAKNRSDLRELLAQINCAETFSCVERERKILASYGGGCHQKIGVNILRRPFGEILFLRGLTDAGQVLDKVELTASPGKGKIAQAEGEHRLFPQPGEEATFFERQRLAKDVWGWAENRKFLWVARETALPREFEVHQDVVVWSAGLATWKKLAERGIWVSGTAEGLGESEPTRLEAIFGKDEIPWVKLTHESSHENALGSMATCATYRLLPKAKVHDIRGRTHFFWMSGTAFDRALELFPEIRSAHHASGPGLTHSHLVKVLGTSAAIHVFLSVEEWRRAVLERK